MNKRYIDFVPKDKVKVVLPEAGGTRARGCGASVRGVVRESVSESVSVSEPKKSVRVASTEAVGAVRRPVSAGAARVAAKNGAVGVATKNGVARAQKLTAKSTVKLGVIEDAKPKFVKTDVDKRPLGARRQASVEAATAKAKRIPRVSVLGKRGDGEAKPDAKSGVMKRVMGMKPVVAGRAAKVELGQADRIALARAARERKAEEILAEAMERAAEVDDERTMKVPKAVKSRAPRKNPFINVEKVTKRPLSRNVYPKKPVVTPREEPSTPVKIIEKPEKDSKINLIITIIITIILGAAAGTVAFLLLPK